MKSQYTLNTNKAAWEEKSAFLSSNSKLHLFNQTLLIKATSLQQKQNPQGKLSWDFQARVTLQSNSCSLSTQSDFCELHETHLDSFLLSY